MARVYTISGATSGTAIARDLLEIIPGANACFQLLSINLAQTTEFGDAAAEMLVATLGRGSGAASTGGTTPTPVPHEVGDVAQATTRLNATADRATFTEIVREAFNVQAGWFYNPIPEERITFSAGGAAAILRLWEGPDDPIDFVVRLTFAEIGGA